MKKDKNQKKESAKCKTCGRELDEGRDITPYLFVILFFSVLITGFIMKVDMENKKVECIAKELGITVDDLMFLRSQAGNESFWIDFYNDSMRKSQIKLYNASNYDSAQLSMQVG